MRLTQLQCVVLMGLLAAVGASWPAPSQAAQDPIRSPDVPYVPTPQEVVVAMLQTAEVKRGDILYDLGCGDGRIVIAAAKQFGAQATGVDINPRRIREAEANARAAGVADRVRFLQQDLFATDIRDATVVTMYLLPGVNLRLRPTLLYALKPGARIVSHAFDLGDWQPDRLEVVKGAKIYYWVVPAQVAGAWVWKQPEARGAQSYRLLLHQEFQKIHGTLRGDEGDTPLAEVDLVGDQLRFTATLRLQGQPTRATFTGHVQGDVITGHIDTPEGATAGRREWLAQRESPGVVIHTTAADASLAADGRT